MGWDKDCVRTGFARLGTDLAVFDFFGLCRVSVLFLVRSLSSKAAIRLVLNCRRLRFGFALGRGRMRKAFGVGVVAATFFGGFGLASGFGFGRATSTGFSTAFGLIFAGSGGGGAGVAGAGFAAGGGGGGGGALATGGSGFGSGSGSGSGVAMGFSFGAGGGAFLGLGSIGFCDVVLSVIVTSSTMIGCSRTIGVLSKSGKPKITAATTPAWSRVDMAIPLRKVRHRYFLAAGLALVWIVCGASVTRATLLKPAAFKLPITAITAP